MWGEAGEMVWQFSVLAALAENPGSIPSACGGSLLCETPVSRDLTPSVLHSPQAHW